eukprot:3165453-Prymnesium_polylepis.1
MEEQPTTPADAAAQGQASSQVSDRQPALDNALLPGDTAASARRVRAAIGGATLARAARLPCVGPPRQHERRGVGWTLAGRAVRDAAFVGEGGPNALA